MSERPAGARERLIEGTRELLWDRGYVGTSPTAILSRSGVGQGSMYHHFQGKPDLVLAAERRSAELMQAEFLAVLESGGSAYDRVKVYLTRERDVLRGCSIGRLAADPEVVAHDDLREPVKETFDVLLIGLARAIKEGKAAGEFREDLVPEETASALAAVIQGGYVLARAQQSVEPFDRAIRGALALLRAALRTE